MPIVKSCCYFVPLKLGAIILGVIGVFQCLFQIYQTLPFVLNFDAEVKRVMENDPIDVEFTLRRKKLAFFLLGIFTIFSAVNCVGSILLIVGAYTNSRPKILPYLFIQGTSCVVLIVLSLIIFNITYIIASLVEIYWVICVFGLYQKIIEDVKDTVHVKINTLGLPVFKAKLMS
ncbi:unnamed protein product [Diamesa serratosioi]